MSTIKDKSTIICKIQKIKKLNYLYIPTQMKKESTFKIKLKK